MPQAAIVHTDRVHLVPFGDVHLTDRYVGWLNDAALMRFSQQRHRRHTMDSCRAYARFLAEAGHCFWALETPDGAHVGNVTASCDAVNGTADIGLLVGEASARGRGLGQAAWAAACASLFEAAGMRKVTGGTVASNAAMRRIMEKLGMVPDGVRARHLLVDGVPEDVLHMAFFRDDWPRTRLMEQFDIVLERRPSGK